MRCSKRWRERCDRIAAMQSIRFLASSLPPALPPLAGFAAEPAGSAPDGFAAFVRPEAARYARPAGARGLKVD